MDPLLARAVGGVSSRNVSSCMNRLLPHKRLGLLEELMWDGATVLEPAVPTCHELESALGYGSHLRSMRKRAQQWRTCLRCEHPPSLQPPEAPPEDGVGAESRQPTPARVHSSDPDLFGCQLWALSAAPGGPRCRPVSHQDPACIWGNDW